MGHWLSLLSILIYMLLLNQSQASIEEIPQNSANVVNVENEELGDKSEHVTDLPQLPSDASVTPVEQKEKCQQQLQRLDEIELCTPDQRILQNISETVHLIFKEIKLSNRNYEQDCSDLYRAGKRKSGVYRITLNRWKDIDVYCDMDTDEGGWTVFQRRGQFDNPEDYFYKTWVEYKEGFGNIEQEFWIGNEHLFELSKRKQYELRVDMKDMENNTAFANYKEFQTLNRRQQYTLIVSGYSGTAGDSLIGHHNGRQFSTKGKDHTSRCAGSYKGAWWYGTSCHKSNLNGLNLKGEHKTYADGINWHSWKGDYYSLSFVEMKIRALDF